jgi:putative transposase
MINSYSLSKDPVISFRLRAIKHLEVYGYHSCCDAFQISKTTIYRWRKAYLNNQRSPTGLRKQSTKPHSVRQMMVDPNVTSEIKKLRESHYRLGKEKIKPLLDQFCFQHGLALISLSTIGKVIKRCHLFFQKQGRVYHNPNYYKKRHKTKRLRVKHSWRPNRLGHLQIDTIVKLTDCLKSYAISIMDVSSKFTLTLVYPQLTSSTALDALLKFQTVYPVPILSIQTDNGLEFQGKFDDYLIQKGIKHLFTYPRCPRINGFIERYNRTFQEEFFDPNIHLIYYPEEFYGKLLEYLVFFNTRRVHKGLGNLTPMDYLISKGYFSQKTATYTKS